MPHLIFPGILNASDNRDIFLLDRRHSFDPRDEQPVIEAAFHFFAIGVQLTFHVPVDCILVNIKQTAAFSELCDLKLGQIADGFLREVGLQVIPMIIIRYIALRKGDEGGRLRPRVVFLFLKLLLSAKSAEED